MPTPFSSQDLGRIFDARALTRGRSLGLAGAVAVQLEGDTITATVQDKDTQHSVRITPSAMGRRVVFDHHCGCGAQACAHRAAAALAALDHFPVLRRPEQQTFLDALTAAPPEKERQRVVFELSAAEPPQTAVITTILIGERTGAATPTTPHAIATDGQADAKARPLATALGGDAARTVLSAAQFGEILPALIESGQARWHAGGRRLIRGETRMFTSTASASLPPGSGILVAESGPWYVDASSGAVGRIRIHAPAP